MLRYCCGIFVIKCYEIKFNQSYIEKVIKVQMVINLYVVIQLRNNGQVLIICFNDLMFKVQGDSQNIIIIFQE